MAVSEVEVRNLQTGDQIVIISEDEARNRGHWYNKVNGWAGSSFGDNSNMNRWCGRTLTVWRVAGAPDPHVYVNECDFWWKSDFIAAIIHDEEIKPLAEEPLNCLLLGGA